MAKRLQTLIFAALVASATSLPPLTADAAPRVSRAAASSRIAQHPHAAEGARNAATTRRGDRSISSNRNTNVNVNVDRGRGRGFDWDDDHDHHPIRNGVLFGAAATLTAHAIGSAFYAVPPGCPPYIYGGVRYYNCGGSWYEPQYQGDTIIYVVVADPHR